MPLREVLQRLVKQVEGCTGAIIMGSDGISIDEYSEEASSDIHVLAVEYAGVVKEVSNNLAVLEVGAMEEFTVCAGSAIIVVRPLNQDLFVLLTLSREGNLGKARYVLRRDIGVIRDLLL